MPQHDTVRTIPPPSSVHPFPVAQTPCPLLTAPKPHRGERRPSPWVSVLCCVLVAAARRLTPWRSHQVRSVYNLFSILLRKPTIARNLGSDDKFSIVRVRILVHFGADRRPHSPLMVVPCEPLSLIQGFHFVNWIVPGCRSPQTPPSSAMAMSAAETSAASSPMVFRPRIVPSP